MPAGQRVVINMSTPLYSLCPLKHASLTALQSLGSNVHIGSSFPSSLRDKPVRYAILTSALVVNIPLLPKNQTKVNKDLENHVGNTLTGVIQYNILPM